MKALFIILLIILNYGLATSQTFTVYPDKGGMLQTDTLGNVWIVKGSDLIKFDGINWIYYNQTTNPCLKPIYITAFLIDKQNRIWYGNASGLIRIFNGLTCDTIAQLASDIKSLIQDENGNIWAAIEYQGGSYTGVSLYKYDGNAFATTSVGAWPASFQSICTDTTGNIWISIYYLYDHYYSVFKYDGTTSTEFNYTNSCLPNNFLVKGFDKYNKMWYLWNDYGRFHEGSCEIVTKTEICRDSNDVSYYTQFLSYKGNIAFWQSTIKKLVIYDEPNCTVFDSTNSNVISDILYTMTIDKYGNLWASTFDGNNYIDLVKVCGLIDTCFTVTSPKLQTPSPKLQIFPNPTGDNIKISLPAGSKESDVSIYNISGKEVLREQYKSNEIEINTENFSKGIYLIKISSEGTVYNEKLIIN